MRERSAEEKIKDLHEARELVKDKNIDGISWRHAEALEEKILSLESRLKEAEAKLNLMEASVGEKGKVFAEVLIEREELKARLQKSEAGVGLE